MEPGVRSVNVTKTLHLTNAYHPTSGGIRTFHRALLRRAEELGRPMRLVVPAEEDSVEETGVWGRLYYVKAYPAPAFDRRYRVMLPAAYLPGCGGRIGRILAEEQPDVVEVCDKYSLLYLAALLRKGLVRGVSRPALIGVSCERMDDNVDAYVGGGWSRRLAHWYLRNIYGPPFDCHVACSEYTAGELRQALWDRPPDFIRVCPMGVDAGRYGPEHRDEALRRRLLESLGATDASVLLLYAGRLSPEKNVTLLIGMMERLVRITGSSGGQDYRLVIVGEGPLRAQLAAECTRLGSRVLLLNAVSSPDLLCRYYASADVFVHPNPREPFGIAPLEAMASGVPLVVPNTGGVLSYATSANAWLATPSPEAFAEAVQAAVERPDARRVRRARTTALEYHWPAVADRWFALYDELAARYACARKPRACVSAPRLTSGVRS